MVNGGEYGTFWGVELYNYDEKKNPIVDNILYERDVVCISSLPGMGKSIMALQLLCNLTTGEPFLGVYDVARPMNVLYVQTEGDRAETIERLGNMTRVIKIDNTRWVHMNLPSLTLNTAVGIRMFNTEAAKPGIAYDVIIIDPLYTTVKGSMCDDEVATDWVRNLRSIRERYNCTFVVLHHEGKDMYHLGQVIDRGNANIFGSTFWAAFFNTNYKLRATKEGIRLLELGKERSGKMIDKIPMRLVEPTPLFYTPADHIVDSRLKVEMYLKGAEDWVHMKTLVSQTGFSRATVYRVLKDLDKDKLLMRKMDGNTAYIRYAK